ncbi:glycosyltransferase [Eggerthellaceae bacterium zg-887]|nr:glycosyltransferase [Xiamenia xianingshaonis]
MRTRCGMSWAPPPAALGFVRWREYSRLRLGNRRSHEHSTDVAFVWRAGRQGCYTVTLSLFLHSHPLQKESPMRVLLICHFPLTGSGSGVYTLNIAHALVKQGHEVVAIVPENQPVEQPGAFRVHPVYFNGATDDALDFNFPCFTTHPRSTQTFYDLTDEQLSAYEQAFRAAIEQEVRDFVPDVIHSGHLWLLSSYSADYGVPLVVTVHGTDLIGYAKAEPRFRDHALHALQAAGGIITISEENEKLVHDLFSDQAKSCTLVHNGYNSDVFYPDTCTRAEVLSELGIEGEFNKLVSFAGKFAHFKGIDVLLRGAAKYERDDVATVLAGDGELFDEMRDLADDLGLRHVFFVRNQPHDVLRRLYSNADVSLLTSRKEPFGLVMIEAMACGTPVVGSDDGGAVNVLTPECGLLFRSEDPDDLARQVRRVLDGDVTFDRAHVAADAKARFSQDGCIGKTVAVYEQAIAQALFAGAEGAR